jgi:predicted ATPase
VAQTGACIGRQFSRDLLSLVSPLSEAALEDALQQLVEAALVFRTGMPPNASYMFKHALVQDAAYNSLLKSKRQAIHRQIAESLLLHFPDSAESAPESLAHHYTEGALFDKAVGYWRLAAERASARFANMEAIGHSRKGLSTLAHLTHSEERVELELTLRTGLIAALRMADRYDEALEELDRAESLAARNKRMVDLSRIHHLRGNIYFPLGQVDKCLSEHQSAWRFAKEADSTEDEARALGGIGRSHRSGIPPDAGVHPHVRTALCASTG